jgi:hypothetical protein
VEKLSILKMAIVSIPEIIILTMIILKVYRNKRTLSIFQYLIKFVITIIYMVVCIYIIRESISDFIISGFIYLIVFIFNYKFIWNYNWRQSSYLSFMSIFIIDIAERITSPMLDLLMEEKHIESLFSNQFVDISILNYTLALPSGFVLYFPSRLFEIIIFAVIYFNHIKLNNNFCDYKWKELKTSDKFTASVSFVILSFCLVLSSNNINLFSKLSELGINMYSIEPYLNIYLFITFFLLVTIYWLLQKTSPILDYKEFAQIPQDDMVELIANNSTAFQLNKYIDVFNEKIKERRNTNEEDICNKIS